jgi:predicted porin
MQKKVMAVAVATALAAPAVALAQGSSVQIYGAISMSLEGAQAKGADTNSVLTPITQGNGSSIRGGNVGGGFVPIAQSLTGADNVNEPLRSRTQGAGSNVGVRGREDLGNGIYMGFQAELAMQQGGITPQGGVSGGVTATWRNSGLWLGGRWGEVGLGVWDSPFTVNTNTLGAAHAPYANASTTFAAGLLGGGTSASAATVSGQDLGQWCGSNFGQTSTSTINSGNCLAWATSFNRRVGNSVWYQSPNWAGFSGRVQYGATSGSTSNATNSDSTTPGSVKPWLGSVGLNYTLGGLYAGLGYEYHKDYITASTRSIGAAGFNTLAQQTTNCPAGFALGGTALNAAAATGNTIACIPVGSNVANGISSDKSTGWNVNLRYTFAFGLSIGGYYEWIKWKMSYNNNPGFDGSGSALSCSLGDCNVTEIKRDAWRLDAAYQLGAHTFGLQYAQGNDLRGTTQGGGFNGEGTGVTGWILGYGYSLSKRSSIFAYGTFINNDTNARFSGIVFNGIGPNSGGDPRYVGVGLRHLF